MEDTLMDMHFNEVHVFNVVFSNGFKAIYRTPTSDIVLVRHFLEKSYGKNKVDSVIYVGIEDPTTPPK